MTTSPRLKSFLQSERAIHGVQLCAAAIGIGVIFWKLQFATDSICCGDFDGYYHIKWARMLWEGMRHRVFPPPFTWLPLTSLNSRYYVDHHLLFHFFQVPFTWFGDLRLGAKISAALFASLAVLSCFWLLLHYRIRYSVVWLIALLGCSAPFLYRLNMAKAPPFAIIYLVIAIHFLFKRKHWPLLIVSLLFTWTYDVFVLMILVALICTVVVGWTERRFEWRPLVYILAGTAVGLIVNPYFPQNLHLLYEHIRIKITASEYDTVVGKEWYPYNSWEFIFNSVIACVAMLLGYISFEPADRERAREPLFLLIFTTALMIMTARWKRIVEYWPPFAVIFAAFALQPWLQGARSAVSRLPTHVLDELQPFLDRSEPTSAKKETEWRETLKTGAAALVAILLGGILALNIRVTLNDIASSEHHDYYAAGANWMRSNISSGQIIFNTDWDDFPRLFYFDPSHSYITGLDPNYLYDQNPTLSRLYERITLGQEEDPGPLIRDRFGARYVFSDNKHDDFFDNARASGWFDIVYEDRDCTILHIRDERAAPEPEELQDEGGGETGLPSNTEPPNNTKP